VTNAVKYLKFELRGKRRLHKRPNAGKIKICRRWLSEEIDAIHSRLIVALGATAQILLGKAIPVQANRGKILDGTNGVQIFMTIYPSAPLRLQDEEERRSAYESFVNVSRSIEGLVWPPKANPDVRKAG
jgi:uracil-DNA glycosylase family 4